MSSKQTGQGIVIIGAQFGDEGKGKVVDYYASNPKIFAVVRFNGGANAGHTIVAEKVKYALHLLPSGMVFEKPSFIGNGVVLDFEQLDKELTELQQKKNKNLSSLLKISFRTHLVLPFHKDLDAFQEQLKQKSSKEAGTTKRGIGPAYADKASRFGIRIVDLWDEDHFTKALETIQEYYSSFTHLKIDIQSIKSKLLLFKEKYSSLICDVGEEVEKLLLEGKNILFEGAQATLLDIDHGLYPFGTSSNCTVSGASAGSGIGVQYLKERIGVVKAYTSRVGSGPVMGELDYTKDPGKFIQTEGAEFGTTTGRPRRIGWLDLVAVRYSVRINGFTGLAITKLDILGKLETFKVVIAYRDTQTNKENISSFPAQISKFSSYEPVLKSFKGWGTIAPEEWKKIFTKGYESFPKELKEYVNFIEKETGVQVYILGLGQDRELTFEKKKLFK